MLLREEIERSFGDGPAHPSLELRVEAGRRALRRRRIASAAAVLGVVAVLGTAYAAAGPGLPGRATGQVAVEPSQTPSPSNAEPAGGAWQDDTPIRYVDGELQIRPGVVVHQHIENPYGYAPPKSSDALDLTYKGQREWTLAELTRKGYGYTSSVPSNGWASFEDWVADQVGTAVPGDDGWPETVRLTAAGEVVASDGSEILQRTDDPRFGDSFAPPGTPTGAAVVRAAEDGVGYFVVWRVIDGQLDVITTPPRDVVGATFQELLSYARGQYSSGEGLR
jgi:hypothetical protein